MSTKFPVLSEQPEILQSNSSNISAAPRRQHWANWRKWSVVVTTEMKRQFPSSFALQTPDLRNTGCPLSLKLITMSSATRSNSPFGLYMWVLYHFFSDPRPRNDQCPCANLLAYSAALKEFIFFPMQCRCTLTWRWVVLGNAQVRTFISVIVFLDLSENLQCSEFWKKSTGLHGLSVDSIQFSTLGWMHKQIDSLLPCACGIFTDSAHAQHWIGEYVGFYRNRPFPRTMLPIDHGYSLDVSLIPDQLLLSHRTDVSLFVVDPFTLDNVSSRSDVCCQHKPPNLSNSASSRVG